LVVTSGKSKRHQYKTENADGEDDTDHVELPKQCLDNLPASVFLNGRLVVLEITCALRLIVDPPKRAKQRKSADWKSNTPDPKADTPGIRSFNVI
jgi:hypothetical protein